MSGNKKRAARSDQTHVNCTLQICGAISNSCFPKLYKYNIMFFDR